MSDQQPENKASQADDLTDVDIYCLHCGYNLRGLSGDPRRCPECGSMKPIGLTDPPEALVERQLRLMNMQIILMPLSLCVVVVFGAIGIGMMCDKFGRESGVVLTLVAVAALGFLVWCVREFRSDCGSQPGWKGLAVTCSMFIPTMTVVSAILAGSAVRILEYVLPYHLPS